MLGKLKLKKPLLKKVATKGKKTKPKKSLKPKEKVLSDDEIIQNLEIEMMNKSNTKKVEKSDPNYDHLQYDWIKQRHDESLKIINDNLSDENDIMEDLIVFYDLEKKGIIAEVCIDNFVSRNLKFYPDKCLLLLEMVNFAVTNDLNNATRKVYTPKPSLELDVINKRINPTIAKLSGMISSETDYDDIKIIKHIGFEAYRFVKFTLYQTQEIDIKPSALLSAKEMENSVNQQVIGTRIKGKKYNYQQQAMQQQQQNVINTSLYEILYQDDTKMENNFYFHGSPFQNWYSIINNGLYVPKGHQILHGSAYGVGIYLAKQAATSLSYMGGYTGKCVMGVAQVNQPKKYDKGGFLVVTDQENVRLKYIIVFENNQYTNINGQATLLTNKLTAFQEKSKIESDGGIYNKICIKRINKEFKQFSQLDKIYDFPVKATCNEKEINVWTIVINTPKDKWGTMVWEIRFDNDYPVKPPFVRIVKPHFKYLSGHITIGGAFCNPILTNQKWRASISISNLIEMLIVNMEEGGAQLDETKSKGEYSLDAAKKAYYRYKVAHGWD